jgi:hypothetical protein
MSKYAQGKYQVKNQDKYIGNGVPNYRSGWEFAVMTFFDNNPAITQWASEPFKIPYRNPLTGKNTIYVPDFMIIYLDKNNQRHAEVIEVKRASGWKSAIGQIISYGKLNWSIHQQFFKN